MTYNSPYKYWLAEHKFSIFQMCRDSNFNPCKVTKHDMEIYSFQHICRKNRMSIYLPDKSSDDVWKKLWRVECHIFFEGICFNFLMNCFFPCLFIQVGTFIPVSRVCKLGDSGDFLTSRYHSIIKTVAFTTPWYQTWWNP